MKSPQVRVALTPAAGVLAEKDVMRGDATRRGWCPGTGGMRAGLPGSPQNRERTEFWLGSCPFVVPWGDRGRRLAQRGRGRTLGVVSTPKRWGERGNGRVEGGAR